MAKLNDSDLATLFIPDDQLDKVNTSPLVRVLIKQARHNYIEEEKLRFCRRYNIHLDPPPTITHEIELFLYALLVGVFRAVVKAPTLLVVLLALQLGHWLCIMLVHKIFYRACHDALAPAFDAVVGMINDIVSSILSVINKVSDALSTVADGVGGAADDVVSTLSGGAAGVSIPDISIPHLSFHLDQYHLFGHTWWEVVHMKQLCEDDGGIVRLLLKTMTAGNLCQDIRGMDPTILFRSWPSLLVYGDAFARPSDGNCELHGTKLGLCLAWSFADLFVVLRTIALIVYVAYCLFPMITFLYNLLRQIVYAFYWKAYILIRQSHLRHKGTHQMAHLMQQARTDETFGSIHHSEYARQSE